MNRLIFFYVLLAVVPLGSLFAQAGPPMLTDDSGTPGDGKWENNFAAIFQGSRTDYDLELPMLDINYGVGERTQLKIEMPWVSGEGQHIAHSFDNITLGVKYRFLDEDNAGVALSTYIQPIISFDPGEHPKRTEYGIILPLAANKNIISLDWNLQIGYQILGSRSEFFYGLSASKLVAPRCALIAELHEALRRSEGSGIFIPSETFFDLGSQCQLNPTFTLLLAAGKDIHVSGSYYGYLGLQLHL